VGWRGRGRRAMVDNRIIAERRRVVKDEPRLKESGKPGMVLE
jgi:hypothetical protein